MSCSFPVISYLSVARARSFTFYEPPPSHESSHFYFLDSP